MTWSPYGADSENVALCRDGYYAEPSVVEAVFEAMLSQAAEITIKKGWRLLTASVTERHLASMEIENRRSGG